MTKVTAEMVKELRQKTGAGMMDCKSALAESDGNFDGAIEILRKKGLKSLTKRADKVAAEGTIGVYIHAGDQIAALVELNCETDFVGRSPEFKELAKNLAMQVAAMRPQYVSPDDIPQELLDKERAILLAQPDMAKNPKAEMAVQGRLAKFVEEVALLKQAYVKDGNGKQKIEDLVNELGIKVGEKISVRRFSVFQVGEGIEKQEANLADDVAAMTGGASN